MLNSPSNSGRELWKRLDALLWTDPEDPGCSICRLDIDVYAEISVKGGDPAARLPGVAAHLGSCAECRDDLEGLIAALTRTTG